MKSIKRLLACLLTAILLFGCVPAAAQNVDTSVRPLYSIEFELFEKLMDMVINAAKGKMPEWASSAAKWGGNKFINELFPGLLEDDTQKMIKMLTEMDDQLKEISNMLSAISDQITSTQLSDIINRFRASTYSSTPANILIALQGLDKKTDLTDAERKAERLFLLTNSLGISDSDIGSINTKIDDYTDQVYNLVTMTYMVNLNGSNVSIDLLEVLHQLMMRTYKWENTAYPVWKNYETSLMSYVSVLVMLDEMSVTARYEKCKAAGLPTVQFDSRMDTLNRYAEGLSALRKRAVMKLDDQYRHYWWQDKSDIYFYTQLNTQDVPQEDKTAGISTMYPNAMKRLRGVKYYYNGSVVRKEPKVDFWAPFISYKSENKNLIALETLQQIYQDYEGKKSLWDIFFTENEGKFAKPQGDYSSWHWIFHPNASYALTYSAHLFTGDEIYCYSAADPGITGKSTTKLPVNKLDLCIYHDTRTEPQTCRNSIGIGVYKNMRVAQTAIETVTITDPPTDPPANIPKTGDDTPILLYVLLALLSGTAMAVMLTVRRRNSRRQG